MSRIAEYAVSQAKEALEAHSMRTMMFRSSSRVTAFISILLVLVLATGCAPKVVPVEGPQITMMVETNFTSSEYDAGSLLLWNIGQNTLQTSGTSVVHVIDLDNGGLPLFWQPGSPVRVVQQWNYLSKKPLITTISKDVNLLTLPEGMPSSRSQSSVIPPEYVSPIRGVLPLSPRMFLYPRVFCMLV
ncbi:hypothetical protein SMC6_03080 [Candidatus Cryosericum odellii]|jgi:hypothetical protein|uniref:Uncharacterized protein n=1 Tax=Candidatus Cryosericum odellii TaxID=2290917 RepID=A0A398D280_9BACT|nr:hypothetical protein SMC6_03080 [Candidatus Cryosericum odellii]